MFRRSTRSSDSFATSTDKHARDLGVKFCDGSGISTRAERGLCRLEAARDAVMSMPIR